MSIIDTVTFIGPEPGTSVNYNNSSGLLYNGIRFVGDLGPGTYWLAAVNAGTSQTWYNWGSGGILRDYDQDTATQKRIRVTLPADVTAFGVDLMTGGTNALPVTIRVTDIDGLVTTYGRDTYARPTHAFFGVTSDRAISVAEFWTTTTSTYVFMDDFT
ncbi:MAG: hypothetical protein HYS04_09800, partial [Acidobacteria bacterium]|nr:hypothetical protein [Acidobacteriota bacterium]